MYLLDADTFITPSRLHYSFDIAPGFWEWLAKTTTRQHLASVEAVRDEIAVGHGDLVTWAAHLPTDFWIQHGTDSLQCAHDLSNWVVHPDRIYRQAAQSEFLGKADYHLIAQAKAGDHTVVTLEQPAPMSQRRIKIPDACDAMGVRCIGPYEVYRHLGLRLRL